MAKDYFKFLVSIIDPDNEYVSRYDSLKWLYNIQFRWDYTIPLDSDRASRAVYLLRNLYSQEMNKYTGIEGEPCRLLEMLVQLSVDMAEVSDVPRQEDPGRWFWEMLDNVSSSNDEQEFCDAFMRWMARDYDHNGNGGLFPLSFSPVDQRRYPIWSQASAYMCERS